MKNVPGSAELGTAEVGRRTTSPAGFTFKPQVNGAPGELSEKCMVTLTINWMAFSGNNSDVVGS